MRQHRQPAGIGAALAALILAGGFSPAAAVNIPEAVGAQAPQERAIDSPSIASASMLNPTTVELRYTDGRSLTLDFYGKDLIRLFRDDDGGIVRNPQATPEADILVAQPRRSPGRITLTASPDSPVIEVASEAINVAFDKSSGLMTITDLRTGRRVMSQTAPIDFYKGRTTIALAESPGEYFYGGGVQNGRFSHKGRAINIRNENSWTDGGVASPAPFYWSTDGYGVMFHTFAPGRYDFGAAAPGRVSLTHESPYMDMFVMVGETPVDILNGFYQLTGNPVLLPKFGFYEGHLNAYNRDYWTENEKGILFEDGKRYRESQQNNGGIRESLNGENGNYQFSARAVVDRYAAHDMPLGWVLPNDGYGAGYGQDSTLDGNIANLKSFGDYARSHGVEIGLWTQSDLHPKDGVSALLQRDIVKEVRDAGVRVLKTDVAWVGDGYSFGLNGVADVGQIIPYYGNDARPFIISLDGWAGTQRYATIWSGDQTGGDWEYIRFHIPTYIGSGLSGQPNITSDMDGIFGGKNPAVNIRDFQWKTFTPMQLNMDGWGSNEKYPHALGEPAASINRNYLKLKSELLPYAYTYAHEAIDGKPLVRAMFIDYPGRYTYGPNTSYQYLYGPSLLVAPIYQATAADSLGNDIRNGIYLPRGRWIDYFNGETFEGPCVLNSVDAPIWKLPVFVREGAIIPMVNPNNNPGEIDRSLRIYDIYPGPTSELTEYDDDGTTLSYLRGDASVTTRVSQSLGRGGELVVTVAASEGDFDGYDPMKATEFRINCSRMPRGVELCVGGRKVSLAKATSLEEFERGADCYYFEDAPEFNRFATPGSVFASVAVSRAPRLLVKSAVVDTRKLPLTLTLKGVELNRANSLRAAHGPLEAPVAAIEADGIGAYTLTPSWKPVGGADFYEIEFDSLTYTNIRAERFTFDRLTPDVDYAFRVRAVNADGESDWAEISGRTKSDPLEWAIRGITGESSAEIQPGFSEARLFDFAESGDMFHTRYRKDVIPFDLVIDLHSVNELDKFIYLPRSNGGNGTILRGSAAVGNDKEHWTEAGIFEWDRSADPKEFTFTSRPAARYIKLTVDSAVGNMASGRELYVFKVPGSDSYLPGDINNDGRIDSNDLTSYMNYTGLRVGDPDFEGYVSNGDIDGNGLIDAYDISVVATCLDDGVDPEFESQPLGGRLELSVADAKAVADTAVVTLSGVDLAGVNALSAAITYDPAVWQYVGTELFGPLSGMENLTRDRLHADGRQAVYPTFVNVGQRPDLDGSEPLMQLRFKRLRKGSPAFRLSDALLVDKKLNRLR